MSFAEILGLIMIGCVIVVLTALLSMVPTWLLWNWLCPTLFGLPKISLLQSLGLLLLTGILFRSSGRGLNEIK